MSDRDNTPGDGGLWTRFKNLPVDSMPKTIAVAVGVCLIGSMAVSGTAVMLKPIQEQNKLLDKKLNILQVAGLYEEGADIEETFKSIEPRVVDLRAGKFTDAVDADTFDQRAAAKDPETSTKLDVDPAGISRQANYASVYLIRDDAGAVDKIILPVHGYGLWSTLYGFIALEDDGNEIFGLQFYQHGETPGLGAEVDNPRWRSQWRGKKVFGDDDSVKISVAKVPEPGGEDHHVDALAGASLTSVGVDNLVRFWLGEQGFKPFLANLKNGTI